MKARYNLPCNIAQTLNIVGDRWTLLILHEILIGHATFNEIKRNLEGISANMLSERLKQLEEAGLTSSSLYSNHPPRYAYTLTESGSALEPVFDALLIWGQNHLEQCYKKMIHTSCDQEVEVSYYCPHCAQSLSKDDTKIVTLSDQVTP